jgi:hypothetical protein
MRNFKTAFSLNQEHFHYNGTMIYGSDVIAYRGRYSELNEFFEDMPKEKIRMIHCEGSPSKFNITVLNEI